MYTSVPLLAILSSLAACLQITAGFFPGIGHLISVFATVPVMIAGKINFFSGFKVYLVAGLIIFFIHPLETPIFIFTTGLLGLIMGSGLGYNWNKWQIILSSGLILGSSILICIYILGIPLLGGIGKNTNIYLRTIIIYIFALGYSLFWLNLIKIFNSIIPD